jgi:hypothetical protein
MKNGGVLPQDTCDDSSQNDSNHCHIKIDNFATLRNYDSGQTFSSDPIPIKCPKPIKMVANPMNLENANQNTTQNENLNTESKFHTTFKPIISESSTPLDSFRQKPRPQSTNPQNSPSNFSNIGKTEPMLINPTNKMRDRGWTDTNIKEFKQSAKHAVNSYGNMMYPEMDVAGQGPKVEFQNQNVFRGQNNDFRVQNNAETRKFQPQSDLVVQNGNSKSQNPKIDPRGVFLGLFGSRNNSYNVTTLSIASKPAPAVRASTTRNSVTKGDNPMNSFMNPRTSLGARNSLQPNPPTRQSRLTSEARITEQIRKQIRSKIKNIDNYMSFSMYFNFTVGVMYLPATYKPRKLPISFENSDDKTIANYTKNRDLHCCIDQVIACQESSKRFDDFINSIGKLYKPSELDSDEWTSVGKNDKFNHLPIHFNGLAKLIYHVSTQINETPFNEESKLAFGRSIGNDYVKIFYDDSLDSCFSLRNFEFRSVTVDMSSFRGIEIVIKPLHGSNRSKLSVNLKTKPIDISKFFTICDGRWRIFPDEVLGKVVQDLCFEICMANHSENRHKTCNFLERDIFQPTKMSENLNETWFRVEGFKKDLFKAETEAKVKKDDFVPSMNTGISDQNDVVGTSVGGLKPMNPVRMGARRTQSEIPKMGGGRASRVVGPSKLEKESRKKKEDDLKRDVEVSMNKSAEARLSIDGGERLDFFKL